MKPENHIDLSYLLYLSSLNIMLIGIELEKKLCSLYHVFVEKTYKLIPQ